MRIYPSIRYAISLCSAMLLFSGCDASQTPLSMAPPTVSSLITERHPAQKSWMSRAAVSVDLLYVSNNVLGTVSVYSYPEGHLVGLLTGFISPFGECTDATGDVFIVAYSDSSMKSSTIYEYAHGGTSPIATLSDPSVAHGCAIDPTTGNLAASGDGVAIFSHASGTPTIYYSSQFSFFYCGYDAQGNLYLSAWNQQSWDQAQLVRLTSGSSSFEQISVNTTLHMDFSFELWPSVQWDGKRMTVSSMPHRQPSYIYRLRISGSSATVAGSTKLNSQKNAYTGQFVIQGKTVVGLGDYKRGATAFLWRYAKGGSPYRKVQKAGHGFELRGAAISLGPTQ